MKQSPEIKLTCCTGGSAADISIEEHDALPFVHSLPQISKSNQQQNTFLTVQLEKPWKK